MIVGFSHLVVNSGDITKDANLLLEQEYSHVFSETGLENNPVKKPLLTHYSSEHDLHLFCSLHGCNVELINHYSDCRNVQNRIFFQRKVVSLLLSEGEMEMEMRFWELLGLKNAGTTAFLKRPVPAWNLELNFTEVSHKLVEQKLDLFGVTSIAFIVKNIEKLILKLDGITPWMSELFSLTVDGNKLSIAFLKTPSGIIVELIEV